MWEIWGKSVDAETRIEDMIRLCERLCLMDKHFQILTSTPRPQFDRETPWWDTAYREYRESLWFWCTGLAHEYFGFTIPKNLEEMKIEWFDEVDMMG